MSVLFTRMRPRWFTPVAQLGTLSHLAATALLAAEYSGRAIEYISFAAAEQQILASQSLWLTLTQAVGLLLGSWGALMLATKKSAAVPLLMLTFLIHISLMLQRLLASSAWGEFGYQGLTQPLLLALVSSYLVFLCHRASAAGWLR